MVGAGGGRALVVTVTLTGADVPPAFLHVSVYVVVLFCAGTTERPVLGVVVTAPPVLKLEFVLSQLVGEFVPDQRSSTAVLFGTETEAALLTVREATGAGGTTVTVAVEAALVPPAPLQVSE